jgi:hypothetical protein
MEVAGLAVGIAGIGSAINDCLELYRLVCDARRFHPDLEDQRIFLSIEKERLDILKKHLCTVADSDAIDNADPPQYIDVGISRRDDELKAQIEPLVLSLVKRMKEKLKEAGELVDKINKGSAGTKDSAAPGNVKSKAGQDTTRSSRQKWRSVMWAIVDKSRLESLTAKLRALNDSLAYLSPVPLYARLELDLMARLFGRENNMRSVLTQINSKNPTYGDLSKCAALNVDFQKLRRSVSLGLAQGVYRLTSTPVEHFRRSY